MTFKDRCIIVLASFLSRSQQEDRPDDPVAMAINYVKELDIQLEHIDKEKAE